MVNTISLRISHVEKQFILYKHDSFPIYVRCTTIYTQTESLKYYKFFFSRKFDKETQFVHIVVCVCVCVERVEKESDEELNLYVTTKR